MTTLMPPSLERRFLQAVREEAAAKPVRDWSERDLQLCLDFLRKVCESTAEVRRVLEGVLAEGVEAHSFARDYGPFLQSTDLQIATVREFIELLSPAKDASSQKLVVELRKLEDANQAFRNVLAGALARVSEAPRLVDWERIRAAEEAYARGDTKPFSRR